MASPPQSVAAEATTSRSPTAEPSAAAAQGGQNTAQAAIEPAVEVAPYDVRTL